LRFISDFLLNFSKTVDMPQRLPENEEGDPPIYGHRLYKEIHPMTTPIPSAESLYETNRRNFYDAVSLKKPAKIPVGVIQCGWPFYYAGVRFDELIKAGEVQRIADSYLKFFREIEIDWEWATMLPPSAEMHKALGDVTFDYGEDGVCVNHLQAYEDLLGADIYDKIINDFEGFQKELRDRHRVWHLPTKEESYAALKKAVLANKAHSQAGGLISQGIKDLGIFSVMRDMSLMGSSGFMSIFSYYRGIKNSLIDLRRMPEKVIAASDAIFRSRPLPFTADENPNKECIILAAYHPEGGFLSEEMFDKLFFNNMRDMAMPFTQQGAKILAGIEGRFLNTIDRYKCFPEGSVLFMLDQDDPFEVYKKIKGWASVATGVPTGLLALGSKEECLDYVKRAFDTFAPGGGFLFMPSVMLNSSKDAKIENTVACFELANELAKQ
jgi:hypothetical protein